MGAGLGDARGRGQDVRLLHGHRESSYEIAELGLGKKVEEQFADAEKLYKQVTPHFLGPPPIRFEEEDVDQARAAGVLIEFDRGRPLIVDRSLYRDLAKRAVKRAVEELRVRAADVAAQRLEARKLAIHPDVDPVDQAKRERDQRLRSLGDEAHGVNLDLGTSLLKGLSCVDPKSVDVARFFVLCGCPHRTELRADVVAMPTRWPRALVEAGFSS